MQQQQRRASWKALLGFDDRPATTQSSRPSSPSSAGSSASSEDEEAIRQASSASGESISIAVRPSSMFDDGVVVDSRPSADAVTSTAQEGEEAEPAMRREVNNISTPTYDKTTAL